MILFISVCHRSRKNVKVKLSLSGGKKHEISQTEDMFFPKKLIRKSPSTCLPNVLHKLPSNLAEILKQNKC